MQHFFPLCSREKEQRLPPFTPWRRARTKVASVVHSRARHVTFSDQNELAYSYKGKFRQNEYQRNGREELRFISLHNERAFWTHLFQGKEHTAYRCSESSCQSCSRSWGDKLTPLSMLELRYYDSIQGSSLNYFAVTCHDRCGRDRESLNGFWASSFRS